MTRGRREPAAEVRLRRDSGGLYGRCEDSGGGPWRLAAGCFWRNSRAVLAIQKLPQESLNPHQRRKSASLFGWSVHGMQHLERDPEEALWPGLQLQGCPYGNDDRGKLTSRHPQRGHE